MGFWGFGATVGRDAFRAKIIGADAPRLVLYFNAHIAPQISTWSMPRKDLLELKIADTSSRGGTRSTVAVLSVQSEFPVEPTTGHRNVDEIVTSQIELLLTRDLVTAGATVKDKGLLYRLTANRVGAHELAGAELEALKADVDIVIEATFELSPASADGLSLQLRALRTRDAQILGIASTVDLPTHTDSRSVRPVAGTGYDDVVVRTPIALSSRVRRTLDRLLGDVAARY